MPVYTVSAFVQQVVTSNTIVVVLPGVNVYNGAFLPFMSGANATNVHYTILGSVASSRDSAIFVGADANASRHSVFVGESGAVVGAADYAAVAMGGAEQLFQNFGTVIAGSGFYAEGWSNAAVDNHGTIAGTKYAALKLVASATTSIVNTGLITGARGIEFDRSTATLLNEGEIRSHAAALAAVDGTAASAGLLVTNAGLIAAPGVALRGSPFVDRVVNRGTIDGDVLLNGGNDVFSGLAGQVHGAIRGGLGNDTIFGGTGDDTILGEGGIDRLGGGRGDDVLTGGTFGDTFVFRRGWGDDVVTDFVNGQDKVDLSAFHFTGFAAVNARAVAVPGGLLLDFATAGGGTLFLVGMTKALFDATDLVL